MGAETRIGIVTGLIIVVVASVYFFYGNESAEKDFLVSADAKVSVPPKIPVAIDQKRTAAPSQSEPRAEKRPRAINMSPRTRRQLVLNNPGSRHTPASRSPRRTTRTRRRPGTSPRPTGLAHTPTSPTTLRGAPGEDLVKATEENLAGHAAESARTESPKPAETPTETTLPTSPKQDSPAPIVTPERLKPTPVRPAVKPETERPTPRRTPPQPRRHTVGSGETLSGIAQTYYGSCAKYTLILKANPDIRNPRAIAVGQVLVIPADETEATRIAAAPAARETRRGAERSSDTTVTRHRTYRVQDGDTFYAIAKKMLGNGGRWQEIYRLNKSLVRNDPKRLKPGMVVRLPE